MTITRVESYAPVFRGLSTDIIGGTFPAAADCVGGTVYLTDTQTWWVILPNLTLTPYVIPVSMSGSVVISSGSVTETNLTAASVAQGTTATTKVVMAGGKTNDATAQYREIPEGAGGRSVVTEEYRSLTVQPTNSPVLSVASSYVTGDYVGTSAAPMTFSGCAGANGAGGYVIGALLVDAAKQSIAGELWLFDTTFTAPTDSAAWDITDAVAKTLVAIIPFASADYYASASNSVVSGSPVGGPARFVCGAALQTLYGAFVTRGAPSYASGDLTFRLTIVQD